MYIQILQFDELLFCLVNANFLKELDYRFITRWMVSQSEINCSSVTTFVYLNQSTTQLHYHLNFYSLDEISKLAQQSLLTLNLDIFSKYVTKSLSSLFGHLCMAKI